MQNPECEHFQRAMEDRFDAIDPVPEGLAAHLEKCTECAQIFELMAKLRNVDTQPEPSDADFLAMRRGVLRDIRGVDSARPWRLYALIRKPVFAYAFSILLAGAGFLAGKDMRPAASASGDTLVRQIQRVAAGNRDLQDLERPLYLYENVKIDDAGDGKVALNFDVSRHVDLVLPKSDPLVVDVLMQTLVNPSPIGTKLRALSWAGNLPDPKVRDALIKVMLTDPNLGVRLKAQSRLIEQDDDPQVKEALLRVLQNEESVQMKLVAIDHLASRRVDPNRIQRAIAPAEKQDAATLKAMNYVNENGGKL